MKPGNRQIRHKRRCTVLILAGTFLLFLGDERGHASTCETVAFLPNEERPFYRYKKVNFAKPDGRAGFLDRTWAVAASFFSLSIRSYLIIMKE